MSAQSSEVRTISRVLWNASRPRAWLALDTFSIVTFVVGDLETLVLPLDNTRAVAKTFDEWRVGARRRERGGDARVAAAEGSRRARASPRRSGCAAWSRVVSIRYASLWQEWRLSLWGLFSHIVDRVFWGNSHTRSSRRRDALDLFSKRFSQIGGTGGILNFKNPRVF